MSRAVPTLSYTTRPVATTLPLGTTPCTRTPPVVPTLPQGLRAAYSNTTGSNNTASGLSALYKNTIGNDNTAGGALALFSNTTGSNNVGIGHAALAQNTVGQTNAALGENAPHNNTTGSNNVGLGASAGYNLTTGSNNVDIANQGFAGETGIIRIGAPSTQTKAFIAGIENAKVTGSAVYVTSSGQFGVLASSERYKTAVAPIANTDKLKQLRPVSFHLKTEPYGPVQYGLIAEEVARIYPELVIRDAEGTIQGVRYEELAPMLLNEVQQQATEIRDLKRQQRRYATEAELKDLKQQLQAALLKLKAKDELIARR